ncbi:MAG TPA: mannosyltransferase family protein, partial [Ktedonobacterales bacterium]|nr:mannosyltransferase family protein [Ktedonobacterales bacterium]
MNANDAARDNQRPMSDAAVVIAEPPTTPRVGQTGVRSRLSHFVASCLRTNTLPAVRLGRADWLYLVGVFLLTRLLTFFVALLGADFFPQYTGANGGAFATQPNTVSTVDGWVRLYVNFDSGWYLGISHHYTTPANGPNWLAEWAFFPLYPWTLHVVSVVLGVIPGLSQSLNVDILAGVLVSHAACFGAIVLLYRLTLGELSSAAARRAALYLLIFPGSFFLTAVYPEGLFLLLTVAAFYFARRRQWALAGLLAAAILLTRAQGALILGPIGLEFVAYRSTLARPWGRGALKALWLLIPTSLTLGAYALYSHALTGYWLAFETSARVAWGHRLTPFPYPLIRYLLSPSLGSPGEYNFSSINFAVTILFFVLVVVAWRRLPPSYAIWLGLSVILPLSTNGSHFFSMVRYLTPAFPAFVALAAWSLNQRWAPNAQQQPATQDEQAPPRQPSPAGWLWRG